MRCLPLLAGVASIAAFAAPETVEIPRTPAPPQLSDYMSARGSAPGVRVSGFVQRLPNDGKGSTLNTVAYLSFDETNLYAAFICHESQDRIRGQLAKREDIGNDDVVSLYLDTFHDGSRAYVFSANPMGVQRDGLLLEGQKPDYTFDTIWQAKSARTEFGFVLLFSIPFKSLRFPAAPSQQWGIALGRYSVVNSEDSYWPSVTSRIGGFVQQFATASMESSLSPGRNIQLQPFLTGLAARTLSGSNYHRAREVNGGLDGKVVLADALTFDFTVRPDFSQVESDDPQVTVNQRFEVLFPEKRPFFLENSTYFNTPVPLFFSRRIVSPDYGAKLTGKLGLWAVGALVANDSAPGINAPEGSALRGLDANAGVVSLHRDLSNQSRVGILATTRELGGNRNSVISSDLRLKLNDNWFLTGQWFHTTAQRAGGQTTSGNGGYASLERNGLHFNYLARFTDLGRGVESDLGFIRRVDIRSAEQYAEYRWRPNRKWLLSYGPSANFLINYDHSGRLQDSYGSLDLAFELPRQTEFRIGHSASYEYYFRGFRKSRTDFSAFTAWKQWLSVYGSYGAGAEINYSAPSGVGPFLGNAVSASASIGIRPSRRLRFDETYLHSRLRTASESVFTNHLIRSKINMQFSKELSLRFIADYNALLPNAALFDASKFKRISADILLTYLVQPGTALYIGYTDRFDNLRFLTGQGGEIVNSRYPGLSTARQLFIKISYGWRF